MITSFATEADGFLVSMAMSIVQYLVLSLFPPVNHMEIINKIRHSQCFKAIRLYTVMTSDGAIAAVGVINTSSHRGGSLRAFTTMTQEQGLALVYDA